MLIYCAIRRPWTLHAVPLSDERLRERGFNQAREISRHASRLTGIPIATDACRRVVHTSPQSQLPWKERSKNVRKAFVCLEQLAGLHVAVVDDVLTTGSTMNEVARTLKKAGAARVSAWVVCRTPKPGDRPLGVWPDIRRTHDARSFNSIAEAAGRQMPACPH